MEVDQKNMSLDDIIKKNKTGAKPKPKSGVFSKMNTNTKAKRFTGKD
jgi:hypothetical protein